MVGADDDDNDEDKVDDGGDGRAEGWIRAGSSRSLLPSESISSANSPVTQRAWTSS